jgi:hypothetical protein
LTNFIKENNYLMKLLHLLLILIFVSSFTVSRKIKNKTVQVNGDSIPLSVTVNNWKYFTSCKVKRTELENPTDNKKDKLFFYECSKQNDSMYDPYGYFWKLARKEAENTYSLEYRYMTTFSINVYKIFSTDYMHPSQGKYSLEFNVSNYEGDYVTRTKVFGWINTNTMNAKGVINSLKDTALSAAVNYSTSKQSNDAAIKGLEGIKAQIPTFETSLTSLASALTAKDTQLAAAQTQAADLSAKLAAVQTQINAYASERLATEEQITKTKEDQAMLQAQVTKGTADAEATKTALNDA